MYSLGMGIDRALLSHLLASTSGFALTSKLYFSLPVYRHQRVNPSQTRQKTVLLQVYCLWGSRNARNKSLPEHKRFTFLGILYLLPIILPLFKVFQFEILMSWYAWIFLILQIINLSESALWKLHINSIRASSLIYMMLYQESLENCKNMRICQEWYFCFS